jgi:hypothetical protein
MQDSPAAPTSARDRQLAFLGFNFVLDLAGDGIPGLRPLDSLLVMAVNQANIAPLTRDSVVRARHGALASPAPDQIRRPVSVRAVATSMRMPYETVRRNIRRLESLGACVTSEAGVVVPAAFMLTPAYFEAARRGHERLLSLYRVLCAHDLLEPLPAANYDETEPPVRGAVRLMSDFLLRAADATVSQTGDLVSGLVILPLLAAAAAATQGADPKPVSAAALGRRTRLPAETVRRHAASLVERGMCLSGPGGLVLADSKFSSPRWRPLLLENAVAVQRLYAGLAERGVVAVWERMAEAGAGPAEGVA